MHSNFISTITENKKGDLLVVTTASLDVFEKQSGKVINYNYSAADHNSLSNGNVLSIYVDSKNRMWAAR